MKKYIALLLALVLTFAVAGCATQKPTETTTPATEAPATEAPATEAPATDPAVKVMTHDEYIAAELDAEVIVETYVQAAQGWWEKDGQGVITVYTQAKDGAYFAHEMACSKEDAAKLTQGTKIRITGHKTEWNGEVEIKDATFEFVDGEKFVAEAFDATALLGTDDLVKHQNEFVSFKGMTIEPSKDADGNEAAFLYKWNGSGKEGDDLYFKASVGGKTYSFAVESYLCGKDTDVYKAVKALKVGDKIDMEGFLYWYEGSQPHIVSVTPVK